MFPPTVCKCSLITTSSPILAIACFLDSSHSNRCYDISLWFLFAFPCWLFILMYLSATIISSLENCLFSSSVHCLIGLCVGFLFLNCVSSLYILNVNYLSYMWFANVFSQFIGCLFILLSFFAMKKLYTLI